MSLNPSEVTSRPVYEPLRADPKSMRQWLALEACSMNSDLLSELSVVFAAMGPRLQVYWIGAETPVGPLGPLSVLPTVAALEKVLKQAQPMTVNDRLSAQGTEPFIWSVAALATQAGLAKRQVQLAHSGSQRRLVWCTHCHGLTDGVKTNPVDCAGCGRHLLVRDHFSRRHGAFMGVMVDAEQPGIRPAMQEMFP